MINVARAAQQSALCGRWSPDGHGCRKADNLCQADPLFAFEDFSSTTASGAHVIVPASQLGGALFFTGIHAGPGPLANQTDKFGFAYPPITVRSGDINLGERALTARIACADLSGLGLVGRFVC